MIQKCQVWLVKRILRHVRLEFLYEKGHLVITVNGEVIAPTPHNILLDTPHKEI